MPSSLAGNSGPPLGARPSVGKSALAGNLALNVAQSQRLPVAVFSLEMSRE
ncbi:replicative DNA helicase, partial [Nostoc sp. HG1]|nr:replicative DNA helicase [Nostoc sp. HG1]